MTVQAPPSRRLKKREYHINKKFLQYPKRFSVVNNNPYPFADLSAYEKLIRASWITSKKRKINYYWTTANFNLYINTRENLTSSFDAKTNWFRNPEELVKNPSINLSYGNEESINKLLGAKGKSVFNEVINIVEKEAIKKEWPLKDIRVEYKEDPEIEDWRHVVILLNFNSPFEDANNYLNLIYPHIDNLAERLALDEKEILAELIYLDIEGNNDIFSG